MAKRVYEVKVQAFKTMVIEVEDNGDEASKMEAEDYAFSRAFSLIDVDDVEVTDSEHLKTDKEVEQAKRFCNEFVKL
jgi:hypothetical protein